MMDALSLFPGVDAAAIALLVILVGATVQGSLGFGMGLVAIPILAMFVPDRLPQALILASLPHTVAMLGKERGGIRTRSVSWLIVGKVAGVAPGVAILAIVSERHLQILFALLTLAVVAIMAVGRVRVRISTGSQLVAGTLSGVVGTAAALGGPPVALLYANEEGPTLRTSMSLVVLVGNLGAVLGYALGGRLTTSDLAVAGIFLVPTMLGLGIGFLVRDQLQGPRIRAAVLMLVAASALALLGWALVG